MAQFQLDQIQTWNPELSAPVKVLYITGQGRCGSTILGQVLGQIKGFTHVGELLELWDSLASGKDPCGCGVPLVACNMWRDVLKAAYGSLHESLVSEMLHFYHREAHTLSLLQTTTSRGVRMLVRRLAKPLGELEKLYGAIQRVFNCGVIVDSSKYPFYGYALQLMEGIDPYVLHLIRDPRASAYSFLGKSVQRGGFVPKRQIGPLASSFMWIYKNYAIETMGKGKRFRRRPLRLRYEDFAANPRESLQRILNFVGESSLILPFQGERGLDLEVQHTVSGNPSRFLTGKIQIRDDKEWAAHMKGYHKALVTAATLPLLIKYGYLNRTASFGGNELV